MNKFSIKTPVAGIPLLSWSPEFPVKNRKSLCVSIAFQYLAGFICLVKDRHANNVFIDIEASRLIFIDNKHCMGCSVHGIDAYGFGMTHSLRNYLQEVGLFSEVKSIAKEMLMYLRVMHRDTLIKFSKVVFYGLRTGEDIEKMINYQLNDEAELLASVEPALVHILKNAKQAGMPSGAAMVASETWAALQKH
jgi:hypothetical protein